MLWKFIDSTNLQYLLEKLKSVFATKKEIEYLPDRIDYVKDYLYKTEYTDLEYEYAREYFKTIEPQIPAACSVIRKGNYYGKNYDWLYDENAEFVVKINKTNTHYSSINVCSSIGLTDEFVKSKQPSNRYKLVPFYAVDGMNEYGLTASILVVPNEEEYGLGDKTVPQDEKQDSINALMLVRYILDNFQNAETACEYINQYVEVCYPQKLLEMGYKTHYMISDKDNDYILEPIAYNDGDIVMEYMKFDNIRACATNFHIIPTTFNDDGTVYTPETQYDEYNAHDYNKISMNGSGLERFNYLIDSYDYMSFENISHMYITLSGAKFTDAYTVGHKYTEFVGIDNLTVTSDPSDFSSVISEAEAKYNHKSRNPESQYYGTWQTVHSSVYDLENLTLSLFTQEDFNDLSEYSFNLFYTKAEVDEKLNEKVNKTNPTGSGNVNFGYNNTVSGWQSAAFNSSNHATGNQSFANGFDTYAEGNNSHSEGYGTKANGDNQHVFGKYNVVDNEDEFIEIAGNGNNSLQRSNAYTLDWDGNVWFAGNVTVGENRTGFAKEKEFKLNYDEWASAVSFDDYTNYLTSDYATGSFYGEGTLDGNPLVEETNISLPIGWNGYMYTINSSTIETLIGKTIEFGSCIYSISPTVTEPAWAGYWSIDYWQDGERKYVLGQVLDNGSQFNPYNEHGFSVRWQVPEGTTSIQFCLRQASHTQRDIAEVLTVDRVYVCDINQYEIPDKNNTYIKAQRTKPNVLYIKLPNTLYISSDGSVMMTDNLNHEIQIGGDKNVITSIMYDGSPLVPVNKTVTIPKLIVDTELDDDSNNPIANSTVSVLIPDQANSSNQLADKNFVNSTVQTNTANFRGNWETWSDVPTDSEDYPDDYRGTGSGHTPTPLDYMVVVDASGYENDPLVEEPQTLEGTWRFKYQSTWSVKGKYGWIPEYQVNETPLTAAQLAALNSGITAELRALIPSQQDMDNKMDVDGVSYEPELTEGEEIGTLTINGTPHVLYCKSGGGSGESGVIPVNPTEQEKVGINIWIETT